MATAFALLLAAAFPPALTGDWDGMLTVSAGVELPLILHLRPGASTIDSPDQQAIGAPIVATPTADGVTVTLAAGHATFDGTLSADGGSLAGPFRQNGVTMAARFTRRAPGGAAPARARPQTPQPPFPYATRDARFAAGPVTLAATLTLPAGRPPFAAVVLIAGSGPQDRDETIAGHRPFLLLADRLTRAGIAVLRYDKRGIGRSGGDFARATQRDFAADAQAAVAWLRDQPGIDRARIGLIGHSEGAAIAATIAAADRDLAFAVLLSPPAETGAATIAAQAQAIARASGVPAEQAAANDATERRLLAAVAAAPDAAAAATAATRILVAGGMAPEQAAIEARAVASPWFRAFLGADPLPALRRLAVPALIVAGSRDLQVPPARTLPLIRAALAGHRGIEIVELPGLNHLLQPAPTGLPAEYGRIDTTIDPGALDRIVDWVARTAR